jgi:hypothetical protein
MNLPEEIQNLLSHCENYASEMLMETGEFFPFGALTDHEDRTHHREVEVDLRDIPSNGEIMDDLLEYFEDQYKNHEAKGFALCYEAKIHLDENKSTDAVAIDIKFKGFDELPLFYIPFSHPIEEPQVLFGEMFAVKR